MQLKDVQLHTVIHRHASKCWLVIFLNIIFGRDYLTPHFMGERLWPHWDSQYVKSMVVCATASLMVK